jgi:hypothetical protein
MSTGRGHSIADPIEGKVYFWNDWRPNVAPQVRPMTKKTRAVLRRWNGLTRAHRLGSCSAAGESGSFFMITRGPGLKGLGISRYMVCLSADGVLLSEGYLSTAGYKPHREAAKVTRGPLPFGIFSPPDQAAGK